MSYTFLVAGLRLRYAHEPRPEHPSETDRHYPGRLPIHEATASDSGGMGEIYSAIL